MCCFIAARLRVSCAWAHGVCCALCILFVCIVFHSPAHTPDLKELVFFALSPRFRFVLQPYFVTNTHCQCGPHDTACARIVQPGFPAIFPSINIRCVHFSRLFRSQLSIPIASGTADKNDCAFNGVFRSMFRLHLHSDCVRWTLPLKCYRVSAYQRATLFCAISNGHNIVSKRDAILYY